MKVNISDFDIWRVLGKFYYSESDIDFRLVWRMKEIVFIFFSSVEINDSKDKKR